jgi:Protein of unknown function (DUF2716)
MELEIAKAALPESEAAALHAWMGRFDHRVSGRKLGLEPWYIDGCIPLDATEDALRELAAAIFETLRELTPSDGFVHFADIQHDYTRFYPHRVEAPTFDDLIIDGETIGYIAADRTWGLVSFRWISPTSVCFFGEPLVSRLRARRPALLAALLPISAA